MIKGRILKRLTRFGLCFYLFAYCMAFTVCAEEYPVLTPDAGAAAISDEAAYEESAEGICVMITLICSIGAKRNFSEFTLCNNISITAGKSVS